MTHWMLAGNVVPRLRKRQECGSRSGWQMSLLVSVIRNCVNQSTQGRGWCLRNVGASAAPDSTWPGTVWGQRGRFRHTEKEAADPVPGDTSF